MAANVSSVASSLGGPAKPPAASTRPWYVTYNPVDDDGEEYVVLIWRQGERLKIRGGEAAGEVVSIAVSDEKDKTVMLKGYSKNGDRQYNFIAQLSKFVAETNPFTRELSDCLDDPYMFCEHFSSLCKGIVVNESESGAASRKRSLSLSLEPRRKKRSTMPATSSKDETDDMDDVPDVNEEIAQQQIGVIDLQVSTLRDPPDHLKIREVKPWYVNYLAEMMLKEGGDHEDLTAPLLVIASVNKDSFVTTDSSSYTYQVIGGLQRYSAIKSINEKEGSKRIVSRKCAVYGKGMSRAAMLVLARQHNEFNQIQRSTSFPEMAASCRRIAFIHFASGEIDDGNFELVVPRYNTQSYRKFKEECLTFLVSSQVGKATVEQAIQMALQPTAIYHKLQTVFEMFERGAILGQKQREYTAGSKMQMALEGKFAAKLTKFKIFQGLQADEKDSLLDDLIQKRITFPQAETKSKDLKMKAEAKEAFLKETMLDSWEEAEGVISKIGGMEKFSAFKFKRGKPLPPNFEAFCMKARTQIAMDLQQSPSDEEKALPYFTGTNVEAFALSGDELFKIDFGQSCMIFISLESSCNVQDVEKLLQGVCCSASGDFSVVLYNMSGHVSAMDAEASLNLFGAKSSRVITVSSVCKSEGGIELATVKEVAVAWWGTSNPPKGHILFEDQHINGLVCHPQEEETMVVEEPGIGWIQYLCQSATGKSVADLYGQHGEVTQVCQGMGVTCTTVLESTEAIDTLLQILGMEKPQSEIDTQELLNEMSFLEKNQPSSAAGKGKEPAGTKLVKVKGTTGLPKEKGAAGGKSGKTKGSEKKIVTRSTTSGQRLSWSKKLGVSKVADK